MGLGAGERDVCKRLERGDEKRSGQLAVMQERTILTHGEAPRLAPTAFQTMISVPDADIAT